MKARAKQKRRAPGRVLRRIFALLTVFAAALGPAVYSAADQGKVLPLEELVLGEEDSALFTLNLQELLAFCEQGGFSAPGGPSVHEGTSVLGGSSIHEGISGPGGSYAPGSPASAGKGTIAGVGPTVKMASASSAASLLKRANGASPSGSEKVFRATGASASGKRPENCLRFEEDSGAPVVLYVIPRRGFVRFLFENSGDQSFFCSAVFGGYATEPVPVESAAETGRAQAAFLDVDLEELRRLLPTVAGTEGGLQEGDGAEGAGSEDAVSAGAGPEEVSRPELLAAISGKQAASTALMAAPPVLKAAGSGVTFASELGETTSAIVFEDESGNPFSVQMTDGGTLWALPVVYTADGKVRSARPELGEPEAWTFTLLQAQNGIYNVTTSFGGQLEFGGSSYAGYPKYLYITENEEGEYAFYRTGTGFLKATGGGENEIGFMSRYLRPAVLVTFLKGQETGLWFSLAEVEPSGPQEELHIGTVDGVSLNAKVQLFDYDDRVNSNALRRENGITGDDLLFYNHKWNEDTTGTSSVDGRGVLDARGYPAAISSRLYRGFPETRDGGSLKYLFDSTFKVGEDLSGAGLFQQDEDGYYWYDSAKNAAYFDGESFTLYDCAIRPNYYNRGNSSLWAGEGREDERSGNFFPFNPLTERTADRPGSVEFDDRRLIGDQVPSYLLAAGQSPETGQVDLWFGMTVEFRFLIPKGGQVKGKDMIFDFWGDDDVYVYVDDVLVMDIGGCHWACGGTVNFSEDDRTTSSAVSYMRMNTDSDEAYKTFSRINRQLESTGEEEGIFPEGHFAAGTTHTLRFFYLERGGDISYCRLRFNLPTLPQGGFTLEKQLTAETGAVLTAEDRNQEFLFRAVDDTGRSVLEGDTVCTVADTLAQQEPDQDGVIRLKGGETAMFSGPLSVEEVWIEELLPEDTGEAWQVTCQVENSGQAAVSGEAQSGLFEASDGTLYHTRRLGHPVRPEAGEVLPRVTVENRKRGPLRRMPDTGAPPAAAWAAAFPALVFLSLANALSARTGKRH